MKNLTPRSSFAVLVAAGLVAGLTAACGSGGPVVLTSTPESVAVEFDVDGKLSDTKQLAAEECEKRGLIVEFDQVEQTATPHTRVAKYRCVSPNVSAPAPAAAPAATPAPQPAETAAPETTEEAPATDTGEAETP